MNKYYQTLELENNASESEIKKAHRRLSKKYHPDMEGGDEGKFKEIQEAYEILTGKKKPEPERRGNPFDGFSDFFGGGGFEQFFGGRNLKGKNIVIRIQLTLEEVFSGVDKEITFQKTEPCVTCDGNGGTEPTTCNQCNGSGMHQIRHGGQTMVSMCNNCRGTGKIFSKNCGTCGSSGYIKGSKTLKVNIPKGVESGTNLIMRGVGNGVKGGTNGDVICHIEVLEHKEYERDGVNLHRNIEVPVIDMILGTEIEFTTLDGNVKIPIPKYCQTDKMFRLRSKGLFNNSGLRGDLFVTVKPKIPKEATNEEIEQLNILKESPNFN